MKDLDFEDDDEWEVAKASGIHFAIQAGAEAAWIHGLQQCGFGG